MESQSNYENPVKIALRERNDTNSKTIILNVPNKENIVIVGDKPFSFDYVLKGSQEELFLKLGKPLVDKTLLGFNTTCLAYGQTGTGKTYSMGLNCFDYTDQINFGIIPRSLEAVFDNINNENILNSPKIMVSISYVEIYNEKVYDMFAENHSDQINIKGCRFVSGVKKKITSTTEAFALLKNGNQIRHVRPTKLNGSSSRSHAVFTIHILKNATSSCLNLVDLAGSEGIRRTGHKGIAREEGVNINQGLLAIGMVLQAIISKNSVIPYRDSVLTTVLQASLNCDSYFTLLACVSPLQEDLSESLATLRFAQNAKKLKNDPKLNSLINSLKKKSVATPLNLFKRSSNILTNKKIPLKSNTFSTPNKNPMIINKFNYSESAVKKKINMIPVAKHNDTLIERDSNISFNISTSTALEAPVTQSYTPIVRKCILEYDSKIREDLKTFCETIVANENKNKLNSSLFTKTSSTPVKASTNNMPWNEIRSEIKNIVRKEMTAVALKKQKSYVINEFDSSDDYNQFLEMSNSSTILNGSDKNLHQTKNKTINRKNGISPRVKSINLRRSARLSSIALEPNLTCINNNLRRTIMLNSTSSINEYSSTTIPINLRRSVRIRDVSRKKDYSITEKPKRMRRSTKIPPKIIEETAEMTDFKEKLTKKNKPTEKVQILYEKNLLTTMKTNTNKNSNNLKQEHINNILKLLNTGSIKEVTILPQVGLKTAYQIISYRTLNGKYKNLEHVSSLPFWRGTAWERFKKANHIE